MFGNKYQDHGRWPVKQFFHTENSIVLLLLRVILGLVMLPHGMQKVFGWFGGDGLTATLASFSDKMHIPAFLAILVILSESLGGVALIIGFCTRLAAFGILCNMIGAIFLVHLPNGFFMNWSGQKHGEGFEFHLLAIAIALSLVIAGGGKDSVDRFIRGKL